MEGFVFNLNEYVYVKMLDKGYQHMADIHNKYCGEIKAWEKYTQEHYRKQADENGYTKMQAWNFIETFGSVTGIGKNSYYELNILFASTSLTAHKI